MNKVLLSTQGLFYSYDGDDGPVVLDVSDRAHEFLFEAVELGPGVRLYHVFKLFNSSELLAQIYRRDFSKEFLQAFSMCTLENNIPEYSAEGIEYLELYQWWEANSKDKYLHGHAFPMFHGQGFQLKEDTPDGFKKGYRIGWSVSFVPLQELINLPLIVNEDVKICEDDLYSVNFGKPLLETNSPITLGQLFKGIFWEISFYGSPEEASKVSDTLQEAVADIKAEESNGPREEGALSSFTSLEEALGLKSAIPEFFEATGEPCDKLELDRFIRTVEDSVLMKDVVFPSELNIRLKDKYFNLTARDFREAMSVFEVS